MTVHTFTTPGFALAHDGADKLICLYGEADEAIGTGLPNLEIFPTFAAALSRAQELGHSISNPTSNPPPADPIPPM